MERERERERKREREIPYSSSLFTQSTQLILLLHCLLPLIPPSLLESSLFFTHTHTHTSTRTPTSKHTHTHTHTHTPTGRLHTDFFSRAELKAGTSACCVAF